MNCTRCGAPLKENAKFCTKCGQKVVAATASKETTPVTQEAAPASKASSSAAQPAQDIRGVNGRIYWNIQPGQVARAIDEVELNSYENVRGIIVPEGTRAYIRVNGRTIASISGGSYDLGAPHTSFLESVKNGLSNGWNFIVNLFGKSKEVQQKSVDEIMFEQQQQLILENAKRGAAFSVVILLEKAFPLLIGQKRPNLDDYKEIIPMKIQTQYLDMELILNAYFKIADYQQFILHYLTERTTLNTTIIVNEISGAIRRAIQDVLYDKNLTSNVIPNDLYTLIKENINNIAQDTFFGLSLVRIVEISADNADIERFRALSRELYLSEQELDYLKRTNDFKNRLADTVNAQKLSEAKTELELRKALDEINKDGLLHDNEIGKFLHVLANERIVHDAKNDDERDAALAELYKSDLLRKEDVQALQIQIASNTDRKMHALQMMRLRDGIEFERVRLEGEIEKATAVVKNELALQGLKDDYMDSRFYKDLDKQKAAANASLDIEQRKRDMDYNDAKRAHDMQREDDDAQFQQFLQMQQAEEQSRENQRRHEADMEKARLQNAEEMERMKWENAKDLSDEKVWALKGGEAASVYAANKYSAAAERDANERLAAQKREDEARLAAQKREDEARLDRERASRDEERRENQSQMFQMMRDMMAMTGGIQAQKLNDRDRQIQERESRLLRQEERMDTAYDRALDYTTRNNVQPPVQQMVQPGLSAQAVQPIQNQVVQPAAPIAQPAPSTAQPATAKDVIICPECGTRLEPGTKFCADCGSEIA